MTRRKASPEVVIDRQGSTLVLRINRPSKLNALNAATVRGLVQAFEDAERDDSAMAIILTGAGKRSFSAGADMAERLNDLQGAGTWPAIDAATSFPKPLIAAVNGLAYGGGAVLALACDLRIGCEASMFRFVGAAYGLVAGAAHLPRVVGVAKAKEYLFTARAVGPDEALTAGLLNRLVPQKDLLREALSLADGIIGNSQAAVRAAKQVVDASSSFGVARELEDRHNASLRAMPEHRARFQDAASRAAKRTEGDDGARPGRSRDRSGGSGVTAKDPGGEL